MAEEDSTTEINLEPQVEIPTFTITEAEDVDTFVPVEDASNAAGAQDIRTALKQFTTVPSDAPSLPLKQPQVDFPESYKVNSDRELVVLSFIKNFDRQFRGLYGQRKPLLLIRPNECAIDKFVCNTIRPTLLPYKSLYNYADIAQFVAEYLSFDMLPIPTELPATIASPSTVLWNQRGNSFEYSILLCSLLEGAGYDAYVCTGYATREVCFLDRSRHESADTKTTEASSAQASEAKANKYAIKPPKKLESKYLAAQQQKKQAEQTKAEKAEADQEAREIEDKLKPGPDSLHGLRVHAWVVVLKGKREVPEDFFIETNTGQATSCLDPNYLGLESVFNSKNYWVNMTQCIHGLRDIVFDLSDSSRWEFVFPTSTVKTSLKHEEDTDDDPVLDVGPSWVEKISITPQQVEQKCPVGKRTVVERNSRTDMYAAYLREDGLVKRVSISSDLELTNIVKVIELYLHRKDKLIRRVRYPNGKNQITEEYFEPGRSHGIRQHNFEHLENGTERREYLFYNIREDGLIRRVEEAQSLEEEFAGRPDFLVKRVVAFRDSTTATVRLPLAGKMRRRASKDSVVDQSNRPIATMTETFLRNPAKPANDDIAVRVFSDDITMVTYHKEDRHATSNTRIFEKPQMTAKRTLPPITSDMVETYTVSMYENPAKNFQLHKMFIDLQAAELTCKQAIRASEVETLEVLRKFQEENNDVQLDVSFYDTTRNQEIKKRREEMEQRVKDEAALRERLEQDYLAPFLAQLDDPDHLTPDDAILLKDRCLKDLKERLVEKAQLIQEWFDREQAALQQKQAWFQQNQGNLRPEEEQEYVRYCTEAIFRIKILEARLELHKEQAPQKYIKLDQTIRSDPRLSHLL